MFRSLQRGQSVRLRIVGVSSASTLNERERVNERNQDQQTRLSRRSPLPHSGPTVLASEAPFTLHVLPSQGFCRRARRPNGTKAKRTAIWGDPGRDHAAEGEGEQRPDGRAEQSNVARTADTAHSAGGRPRRRYARHACLPHPHPFGCVEAPRAARAQHKVNSPSAQPGKGAREHGFGEDRRRAGLRRRPSTYELGQRRRGRDSSPRQDFSCVRS